MRGALGLALGLFATTAAWAQGPATFTIIRAPAPYTDAEAVALSADAGVVVGTLSRSDGTSRAFRWTPAGGVVLLNGTAPDQASAVRSISSDGSVAVGLAIGERPDFTRIACAVRWVGANPPEITECPPILRIRTVATACSANGARVSNASFLYGPTGAATSSTIWSGPGTPYIFHNDVGINAMSDDGVWTFGGIDCGTINYLPQRAFRWNTVTFNTLRIERPAGAPATGLMEALACNPAGTIAVGAVGNRAFRWIESVGVAELLTAPAGAAFDAALSVNADGTRIVGTATTATFQETAVLWRDGTPEDLAARLFQLGALIPSGTRLLRAEDITPDGNTIVGQAMLSDGTIVGYIAQLSGPARCVADVDDGSGTGMPDGGVTIDDLLYYLTIFADGNLNADVDDGSGTGMRDGGVTIDDLLYYLQRFADGC